MSDACIVELCRDLWTLRSLQLCQSMFNLLEYHPTLPQPMHCRGPSDWIASCKLMSMILSVHSCLDYTLYRQLLLISTQIVVGGMSSYLVRLRSLFGPDAIHNAGNLILRTYALYGRDKRIITIVPAVAAVLMGFSCVCHPSSSNDACTCGDLTRSVSVVGSGPNTRY